jgi:tetratricopeptide (TPR) repeat protein
VVVVSPVNQSYSREHVQRMLNVSRRQLQSWEKQDFVRGGEAYTFRDIIAMRALLKLREKKVPPIKIGQALTSLRRKLSHIESPLSELKLHWDGGRISVQIAGQKMEAVSGQLLLDFDSSQSAALTAFASRPKADSAVAAEHWFQQGLSLEEIGAPIAEAVAAYEKAIELNPAAAGALVNLGTIFFRDRKLKKAESCYQKAMAADPQYPLAHFNLANLYDEQGHAELARKHYLEAIRLDPKYADAFFNLALICEQEGEPMKAMSYWNAYLKLDASSSWADIARRQMERLKQAAFVVSR